MQIEINADQTVAAVSAKGLTGVMASSVQTQVNALTAQELTAVILAVRWSAFPLGGGEAVYREALARITGPDGVAMRAKLAKASVGELRKWMLARASQGCNAPHDSYLRIAYDVATTGAVDYGNRY